MISWYVQQNTERALSSLNILNIQYTLYLSNIFVIRRIEKAIDFKLSSVKQYNFTICYNRYTKTGTLGYPMHKSIILNQYRLR